MLILAAFGTAVLSAIFGMAGGLILMGVYTATLPVAAAMVLHGLTQLCANGLRALLLFRHVHRQGVLAYVAGALLAMALVALVRFVPDARTIYIGLGLTPFLARILPFRPDFTRPSMAFVAGVLTVGLQLTCGVAGPLLDIFFIEAPLDRRGVVATKAVTQTFAHLLKIAWFSQLLTTDLPATTVGSVLGAALIGTFVGSRLLERISEQRFRSATRWLVLGLGGFYLYRGVWL